MNRSTMLPVVMIIVIVFVVLMTMTAARTNAPDVVADRNYPHHICTTNRYCTGTECTDDPISFIVYLSDEDGLPRLDFPGWDPRLTLTETINGDAFESAGGETSGTITIFNNRDLDIVAKTVADNDVIEHYASGSCSRLKTP